MDCHSNDVINDEVPVATASIRQGTRVVGSMAIFGRSVSIEGRLHLVCGTLEGLSLALLKYDVQFRPSIRVNIASMLMFFTFFGDMSSPMSEDVHHNFSEREP
jgi:hypothetical protein